MSNRAVLTLGVVCCILSWASHSVAQASGLVAAYSFNEGTGSTVSDLSGHNLTGTVVGAAWSNQGRFGNALSFNGSSGYVDLGNPAAFQLTGSMTLEAWVKATANPSDDGQIIAKSNGTGWEFKTSPDTGPHTFGVQVTGTSGSVVQRYSTTVRSLNTWYHVASVYNASTRKLDIYVNGILNDGTLRGTIPGSQANQSVNVNIGRRSGGFYFNGLIDEVRIYNRALSQAEIQTDMNTPLGGGGGDTQSPTAPSALGATSASGSQINLSWTASADNVGVTQYLIERCQGAGCSNFAQVGTSATTTFNNTGLTNATSYSYRVRATDAAGNLSAYSNVATAVTPDTQAPTAPSNLAATAVGGSQINLTWTASTDNVGVTQYLVERCSGNGCANFTQVGTSTSAAFTNTGLTPNTSYSYRVRATDAAGNLSGYSNVASATTQNPDTQPPTAPSSLTATAAGGTQINLSWTASTDNVGVTNYMIERCQDAGCSNFAQVGTALGTTFSNIGLTNATSYSYRVRATDAAGNLSPYSNVSSATTPDAQAPTAPSSLTATAISSSQINLSWTASTDNVGVTGYQVERCQNAGCSNFAQVATTTSTTFNNTGLTAGTSYSYRVRATDAAGNLSAYSNVATAVAVSNNATITYVQGNYADPQSSPTSVVVKYNAAQVAGDLNVVAVGWNDSTRTVSSVTDTKGNVYQRAVGPTIVTGALSQSIYYAKNIVGASAGTNSVTVAFSGGAAYPDIRILEYSGADLANPVDVTAAGAGSGGTNNSGSVTTTNATDLLFGANMVTGTTTAPGSGFTQRLLTSPDSDMAEDRMVTAIGSYSATATASGQWIMQMVAFRTLTGVPDIQPPTPPSNLAATAVSGSQINLTWTGSADNIGVAGYLIERCTGAGCNNFVQTANTTATNYSDTGLTASTSYSFRVRATDGAGNLSSYSSVASASTAAADTQPPTTPTNLTANAVSANQVNLAWTASSDNVGVAGYTIYRNSTSVGTATSTLYSDTGLSPNTTYTYTVSAFDAAGNSSSLSQAATVTTPAGSSTPVYPLKAATDGRYLVDQNNVPLLLVGDSPHAMFVNPNSADLTIYLANRQARGFNILWVEGLCSDYILNCRNDLSTYDGIKPFTSGTNQTNYDVSTPNEVYWSRVDSYVNAAAAHNITILFDTWETAALMPMARTNGNTKMRNFGIFLGNRYKDFPNIIWITGNDFQTWTNTTDNTLMQNLMAGIASVDTHHLQTTELDYNSSGSMDDALLVPYTTLAGAYDYYCSYGETLSQYNHSPSVPVFFEEGFYEYNYRGTVRYLRTQAWWAALAGATAGQMYGSENTAYFASGWQNYLDTTGVAEFDHLNSLLKSMNWYKFVPDQAHIIVTAGYGTADAGDTYNCIDTNDYVTTSYLTDGTASLSYAPQGATVTVDLSKFRGPVNARWYDPTSGDFTTIPGSPFVNSGRQNFSTPGGNSAGDPDWVLLLTAS